MDAFFASGRHVDLAIGIVLAEALLLAWWGRRAGWRVGMWWPNLLAGALLMLALRAQMLGWGWPWVAAALALAGAAHAWDLWNRLAPTAGSTRVAPGLHDEPGARRQDRDGVRPS